MNEVRRVLKPRDDEPKEPEVQSLTVSYGEELYSPVQFNTFRIGGHSVTVKPTPGETTAVTFKRASAMLRALVDEEFNARIADFRARMKRL